MGIQSKVNMTCERDELTLQVINLSDIILTTDEINLLKKVFTFTPTPAYNAFEWIKDLKLFGRRLALQ